MRDVFYDWFDDERAPRPVSKTPPARPAARRKLLDSLLVEIASADDPRAGPNSTLGVSGRKGVLPPESRRPARTSSITTAQPSSVRTARSTALLAAAAR